MGKKAEEVGKKTAERTAVGAVAAAVVSDVSEAGVVGKVLSDHTRVFVHLFERWVSLHMLAEQRDGEIRTGCCQVGRA